MALSDCPRCWETPCACGHEYVRWTTDRLRQHIDMLNRVLARKIAEAPRLQVGSLDGVVPQDDPSKRFFQPK